MALLVWLPAAFILYFAWEHKGRLERRLAKLEAQILELQLALASPPAAAEPPPRSYAEPPPRSYAEPPPRSYAEDAFVLQPASSLDRYPPTEAPPLESYTADLPLPAAAPAASDMPAFAMPAPAPAHPHLQRLKQQLSANWTGVLGAVIFVTGIAFFGVLASLFLGPVGRFALILAVAALAYGVGHWLQRRAAWAGFASWLWGISGATCLFACVGASAVASLKFISDAPLAHAVLLAGIAVNLSFAYRSRLQEAASLHVVLSLVALAVAPASWLVLGAGTAVALFGTCLSYRPSWEQNLLVILIGFAAFHFHVNG